METLLVVAFLILLGPLAIFFGVDSRSLDERDHRTWWPGARS
jgi:hypothetical protein